MEVVVDTRKEQRNGQNGHPQRVARQPEERKAHPEAAARRGGRHEPSYKRRCSRWLDPVASVSAERPRSGLPSASRPASETTNLWAFALQLACLGLRLAIGVPITWSNSNLPPGCHGVNRFFEEISAIHQTCAQVETASAGLAL